MRSAWAAAPVPSISRTRRRTTVFAPTLTYGCTEAAGGAGGARICGAASAAIGAAVRAASAAAAPRIIGLNIYAPLRTSLPRTLAPGRTACHFSNGC